MVGTKAPFPFRQLVNFGGFHWAHANISWASCRYHIDSYRVHKISYWSILAA
ncbi:hypothetical protein BDV34DRAFT_186829 [Aspergillus parasiticus]|uniref:Uncharacterized protein n=2 Tax=Aspergillus subgen. Circumdati TaxID=2720871 RepID=A0A5N6DZH4_ASPPA|nr:hypothetical protein BDV34DRAFT_186829 [Aspergillus parasiticus]KAE8306502.1 hypothetical protein BDV41DRAFT_558330 [Aspergillus transmontanensis]